MKQNITREQRRKNEMAERTVRRHRTTQGKLGMLARDTLRIVPLGGQNGIGEKKT